MTADVEGTQQIAGFCGLCIARCGTIATVEAGRFTRLNPDPSHPTGAALCAKGRAAPDLVYSKDRLTRPLRRRQPKGHPDPGWEEISWDLALTETVAAMRRIADQFGPEAVAFSQCSPSTTAIGDASSFVRRLMHAFGTPNQVSSLDLCGWGRGYATRYAFGVGSVGTGSAGGAMPDIERSGCLLLWGYNPSHSRLTHATATVAALKRGLKLIVVDPRNAGLANKADVWLRLRPGTDGALALGLANLMIQRGWYDRDFIRDWSNGPLLVRSDTGRLLRESDLVPGGDARRSIAWDARARCPTAYDPDSGRYLADGQSLALEGDYRIDAVKRSDQLPAGLRSLCLPVPKVFARGGRGDVLDSAKRPRGGRAPDLARPPSLLLRLERARTTRQHNGERPSHCVALCVDRLLRCARW